MTREQAVKMTHEEMMKFPQLKDWHVRITTDANQPFLGLCSYKDKCIILNAHHIDIHPDPDIRDTILHEIAHALCPGNGHNEVWRAKAYEIGCRSALGPCSTLALSPEIIDAIRSGADVKVDFEEEIIRRPKYQITRLQDKCPTCGKVAEVDRETMLPIVTDGPDTKIIFLKCGHTVIKSIPKGTPFHKFYSDAALHSSCEHVWDKNTCIECGCHKPFEFQVEGMRFIEQALATHKGAAIFDEMGLGKTIQALGYINYHPESWPVLYAVKSGIKFQWYNAILTWLGEKFIGQVINSSKDFIIPGLRTYIISYDMLVPKTRKSKTGALIQQGFDIEKLIKAGIKTLVLDECQQIKNPDSSRTQQIRKLAKVMNVIGLSGTPWKNRGSEFYSILNMIAPMKFPSFDGFKRAWVSYYFDGSYTKEGGISNPKKFKEYIKDIAIRRERTEVMKELPLINRTKLSVELSELEQGEYDKEEETFVNWYNDKIIGGEQITGMNILAQMSRMRHLTGLAKIPATLLFVEEFVENTENKLVIFVHHKDVGQILLEECKKKFGPGTDYNIPVMELTGAMSSEDRFEIQQKFNATPRCIMIASTLASGEGLNLQTCADCVMHEPQWNPQNEEQAEGRFIRIGQTALSVNATYAEAIASIDDHFGSIRERKRLQFHSAMNKGEIPQWDQNTLAKEVAERIVEAYNKKKRKPVVPPVVPIGPIDIFDTKEEKAGER